jgi:hypothetical protein
VTARVEVQVRNLRLSDRIKQHVDERAGRLDHYLPAIEQVDVELTTTPRPGRRSKRGPDHCSWQGLDSPPRARQRDAVAFDSAWIRRGLRSTREALPWSHR